MTDMESKMSIIESIVSFLTSLFGHKNPSVLPVADETPRFLLPETAEKYREVLSLKLAEVENFRSARLTEATQLTREAEKLEGRADDLLRLGAEEKDEVKAELLRRNAEKNDRQAKETRQLAAENRQVAEEAQRWYALPPSKWLDPCGQNFEAYPRTVAERQARKWEHEQVAGGEVIHTTIQSPSRTSQKNDSVAPNIWDHVERRIMSRQGKYFLWQLRKEAIVVRGIVVQPDRNPWPAIFSYSPTGEYGPLKTEFITSSVSQMTEAELSAITKL
jgi:hypothetical protein